MRTEEKQRLVKAHGDIKGIEKLEQLLERKDYFNKLLLDTLPHPAMLINRDKSILAANRIAIKMGARIGDYCWQSFGQGKYIPDGDKECIKSHRYNGIPPISTCCYFCLANEAFKSNEGKKSSEINVWNKIWDIYWVPFDKEIFLCYLTDITELKQSKEKIKKLSSDLLRIQEEERQRISKDLHDSIGQTLLAAKINLDAYRKDPGAFKEHFDIGIEFIIKASEELREIYTDLYPSILTDFGLKKTITWYLKNHLSMQKIKTEFNFQVNKKIPHELEVNIYRIFQEIFSNIIKHSKADNIKLNIVQRNNKLKIDVNDNGVGINGKALSEHGGFGLANIRQRVQDFNGFFSINGKENEGTRIMIEFPL